jgi:alkylated DNA repair dioxygenase AlkB
MNFDLFSNSNTCHQLTISNADCTLYPHLFNASEADQIFNVLSSTIQWTQVTISMYGKNIKVPRLSAWYGDTNLSYEYSGIRTIALPWLPILNTLKSKVESINNTNFNSVLLNLYRDGNDSVDWHSDDEPELGDNPIIASLSFGEERQFQLKNKKDKNQKISLKLPHGSMLLMKGTTQENYFHKIPKSKRVMQARINLTFRTII